MCAAIAQLLKEILKQKHRAPESGLCVISPNHHTYVQVNDKGRFPKWRIVGPKKRYLCMDCFTKIFGERGKI